MSVAAIDIGTNSTNLLVVDDQGNEIERVLTVTRLGRQVHATRRLAEDAIDTTLATLQTYRTTLDRHGVSRVRAVATSATRDAANGDDFLDRAAAVLGVRPELLSGVEEGRLAFTGATSGLDGVGVTPPYLVVDIGGGSTELMLGGASLDAVTSIDIGAVRLTEWELRHDPPRPDELTNAIGRAQDMFDDAVREMVPDGGLAHLEAASLVGIAGTITTVAAVEIGLPRYDPSVVHGFRLTRAAAEDVFRTLATESLADRVHNPGLPADRADVIVAGCCILVGIMRRLQSPSLVVSDNNLLHGVCRELLT